MASVLNFERNNADLQRQLLRRIGYTNGLHKIRRFVRVVQYLYQIMPASSRLLTEVIIREEKNRASEADRPLTGRKYVTGIVDVASALKLIERFGPKIALSSEGYACHALCEHGLEEAVIDLFLLERIIEADGEYALNVLRIVSEGTTEALQIGKELIRRFFALMHFKLKWVKETVQDRYSQRTLESLLNDAIRTLSKATTTNGSADSQARLEFFFNHTVKPRVEWLEDLGCIQSSEGEVAISPKGISLLSKLRDLGGWADFGIFLPLNPWLSDDLGIPSMYPESNADDFAWRLVAATASPQADDASIVDDDAGLLRWIKEIYPSVRLLNFNEADALSIYEVLAAIEASKGRALSERKFSMALSKLVREFPSDVFKLTKRRGHGMYIALRKAP